jgi:hypothetical protein
MNLPQFIQKYSLYKTTYINELNETQLKDLQSCTEFAQVKKFNSVDVNDKFFFNNAIDFHLVKLMSNTKFNYKINLHSINIIGPFPIHDVYKMKNGVSQFNFIDEKEMKLHGAVVFKFNLEELRDKFLTSEEIQKHVHETLIKELSEAPVNEYCYFIGIRAHKDSFIHEVGDGEAISIPAIPSDDYNPF